MRPRFTGAVEERDKHSVLIWSGSFITGSITGSRIVYLFTDKNTLAHKFETKLCREKARIPYFKIRTVEKRCKFAENDNRTGQERNASKKWLTIWVLVSRSQISFNRSSSKPRLDMRPLGLPC